MATGQATSVEPSKDMRERFADVLARLRTTRLQCARNKLASLTASLEDIAEPAICCGCASPTTKALVDYEYNVPSTRGVRLTIARKLPGYRCEGCGVEYQDAGITDRFLQLVGQALTELGDPKLSNLLRRKSADPRTYTAFSDVPPAVLEHVAKHS